MRNWPATHKGWKNFLIEMLQKADIDIEPGFTNKENIERLFPKKAYTGKKWEIDPTGRKCNHCGIHKSWDNFQKGGGLNGRIQKCKKCKSKKERMPEGYRRCTKCKEVKSLKCFYVLRANQRKDGTYPASSSCKKCKGSKAEFKCKNGKVCRVCKMYVLNEHLKKNGFNKDGSRRYQSLCRQCYNLKYGRKSNK